MITVKPDVQRMTARHFLASKGRMPADSEELLEWLLEFTEHMADMLNRALQLYDDHMMVCNRPILMTRIEK